MSYPAGVITRQIIIAASHDLTGDNLGGQIQVESPISLKWSATGELLLNRPETIFLDTSTGSGSITLPTIQQGFVGPDGAVLSKWTYLLTPILDPNVPVVEPLVIELGYGDGTPTVVDFKDPSPSDTSVLLYRPGGKGDPGDPGDPGPAPILSATATTLPAGSSATVDVQGAAGEYVINLGIPKGDPGANASAAGVPVAGTTGQVLTKKTNADYDTQWADNAAQGIPAAGTTGQILRKASNVDYATEWHDPVTGIPLGGTTNQYLGKNSGVDGDVGWKDVPKELPLAGTTGQVLTKNSATDGDVKWATPSSSGTGLPSGGTAGQVLTKQSSTAGDATWTDPIFSINTIPAGSTLTVDKSSAGVWPARPTARTDVIVRWRGADPSPAIVSSGTGGMIDNVDERVVI